VEEKVEFRVADIFQLPFDDSSFDVAIAESILTPLPGDKKQALQEIARVIRPGGLIGINEGTIDPSAPPEYFALLKEHPAVHGHFTAETLRKLFEESGLEVVHLDETREAAGSSVLKELGCRGLLSFMVRTYPKIVLKLLSDARFRDAHRIDDQITKEYKQHMGYTLLVARKR
jgi:ubiquinone/menaquinone biosynthesis C-methylase UbiE